MRAVKGACWARGKVARSQRRQPWPLRFPGLCPCPLRGTGPVGAAATPYPAPGWRAGGWGAEGGRRAPPWAVAGDTLLLSQRPAPPRALFPVCLLWLRRRHSSVGTSPTCSWPCSPAQDRPCSGTRCPGVVPPERSRPLCRLRRVPEVSPESPAFCSWSALQPQATPPAPNKPHLSPCPAPGSAAPGNSKGRHPVLGPHGHTC